MSVGCPFSITPRSYRRAVGEEEIQRISGVLNDPPASSWCTRGTSTWRATPLRQGLPLVHFSAQPEPFLLLKPPNMCHSKLRSSGGGANGDGA